MQRLFFLILVTLYSALPTQAQTVTGSWYGKAEVNSGNSTSNYLTELILRQKGDEVEGVFGYYFKDSYQSFFVRGSYDKATREVHIKNLPMLHYQGSASNGIECPMNFTGILLVAQAGSSLSGYFYSDEKYKYTCPDLRVSLTVDRNETNQDSVLKHTVAGRKIWKPQETDYIVSNTSPGKPTTSSADTLSATKPGPALSAKKEQALIEKLEKRSNIYSQDLEIESDSVRISFYDNGDIDGDIISVFLNKNPVLVRQELSVRALNIYLALDSTREYNVISMLAENLGKYPPNTALMVVTDGINRYEVYLSSSLTQNAAIRLKRKLPKKNN